MIKDVNVTHKRLGPLIAMNLVAAKARKCILNVSPAGCGKSAATDTVNTILGGRAKKYTSLTLAGLKHIAEELTEYGGHLIIDDLGTEKSFWSRTSTVTVLASLIHTGYVCKITQAYVLEITNFRGSAGLNIQPVLMNTLVGDEDWVAVIRDKALRYYHLIRPREPKAYLPKPSINWGIPLDEVSGCLTRGKLWFQLITTGLTQWSYARCLEHVPQLLRACAALDQRRQVNTSDYRILSKLLKPMQLERYVLQSFGFEAGRIFDNNVYCILVEIASHGEPTIKTVCEDYKVSPTTVERLVQEAQEWCFIKANSPKKIAPTDTTKQILKIAGVNQKW
uniref:Uncharacterized protein n=1 Tax=viral metagenome TaxID=1070528 RepID=A0A6H2A4M5_9ZZZZ